VSISAKKFVVFSKKNAKDLEKLYDKIGEVKNIVIVDDEADFASPNAKVNKTSKLKLMSLYQNYSGKPAITSV
jgi:hypothetical protein